jgi:hypothetical protein
MPWLLDTAFSPGDLDAGKSYTHQKIAHLEHSIREKFIRLHIERGYIDGSDWVWATQGEALVVLIKDDPAAEPAVTDYTDLVATVVGVGEEGEILYDLNAAALYAYLAANSHIAAGSVVA